MAQTGDKNAAPVVPSSAFQGKRWLYRLARLLAILAISYLGIIILLLFLENTFLFAFRDTDEWIAPVDSRVQDVELRTSDGTPIHAWWCPTDQGDGTQRILLYCHGNGGNISRRSTAIAMWQHELHASVLIFDYPGYGRSGGSPSEAGCYAAADAAEDWLVQTQQMAAEQILIYGESLGGGVAVDLASRRPHRALILDSTFTSIPDMAQHQYPWLPARWLVHNQFNNLAKIGRCGGPVFMAHGTADTLIPIAQAKQLFAAAPEPKQFYAAEGSGHCQTLGPEFFIRLRQLLAATEPQGSG